MTNNIKPELCPAESFRQNKHHQYKSWFKAQLFRCAKCNQESITDISQQFEENRAKEDKSGFQAICDY
ncbi:MAG: hypothetical protein OEL82_00190 [Nitrosopumilus sp.]|nr:hypothetical protein [Nitrosopumilus sp.]